MERSTQNSGTIEVRNAHRFDAARLEQWMESEVEGYAGPLRVEQFRGGQSNPTYKLTTPSRSYVLRRKPPGKLLPGAMLVGFGAFNLVEGIIDHQILGIHHVNETVPREQWIYWDLGFLAWGAAMVVFGWYLLKRGQEETRRRTA